MATGNEQQAIDNANSINNLVNKFVVTPIVNMGIAGFAFDIFEEHKSEQTADITDHFVEDNSTRQDHIAIKPTKFTLRGFVGELVDDSNNAKNQITQLAEKLTIINSYIPVVTNFAKQVDKTITTNKESTSSNLEQNIGLGVDLFQAYKQLNPPDTKQAKAYNFFKALFLSKILVSVETPYGFISDYAIENVVAIQGDNRFISDFTVVLKEFRTTSVDLVDFEIKKNQGRTEQQKAEVKNQGKANGTEVKTSIAKNIFNSFTK
jgi:hypothetical protein